MKDSNYKYAGFWKRFAASVLDAVIVLFFTSSVRWTIREVLIMYDKFDFSSNQTIVYAIWSFYLIIIRWCYFAGLESSPLQATIGKLALGLCVVNVEGKRISFGIASGRFFGKILSGFFLYIGYIMAAFTDKKQALHDQMSNCLVLEK